MRYIGYIILNILKNWHLKLLNLTLFNWHFFSFLEKERPHLGDPFLQRSFEEADRQVDRAVNDTIRFEKDVLHVSCIT